MASAPVAASPAAPAPNAAPLGVSWTIPSEPAFANPARAALSVLDELTFTAEKA